MDRCSKQMCSLSAYISWQSLIMFVLCALCFIHIRSVFAQSPNNSEVLPLLCNTSVLADTTLTEHLLFKEGFSKVRYKTADGVTLSVLQKFRPDARATIIFSTGLFCYATRSAPFHAMLADKPYNLMFINGRVGVANRFIYSLFQFGQHEHIDILGAIKLAQMQSNAPIILHGMCAGGYYTLKAVFELQKKHEKNTKLPCAIILDTAWISRKETSYASSYEHIVEFSKKLVKTRRYNPEESMLFGIFKKGLAALHTVVYYSIFWPWFNWDEQRTNLTPHLSSLQIPVFLIHGLDDKHVGMSQVHTMIEKIPNVQTWLIPGPTTHNAKHLKFFSEYKTKLIEFIEKVLEQRRI